MSEVAVFDREWKSSFVQNTNNMENETDMSNAEFAKDSNPQPGTILDKEKYDAAIKSGKLSEIPPSNIIFIKKIERKNPKTGEMETVDAEPPKAIHTVGLSIKLPSAAEQLKGFYHEDAARIIRESSDYKEFKSKGAK